MIKINLKLITRRVLYKKMTKINFKKNSTNSTEFSDLKPYSFFRKIVTQKFFE